MKKQRSLAEGARQSAELTEREQEAISMVRRVSEAGAKSDPEPTPDIPAPAQANVLPQVTGRVPIGARCRQDIAHALKKASLERQLAGVVPYTQQDILEEAIEYWLTLNNYR